MMIIIMMTGACGLPYWWSLPTASTGRERSSCTCRLVFGDSATIGVGTAGSSHCTVFAEYTSNASFLAAL